MSLLFSYETPEKKWIFRTPAGWHLSKVHMFLECENLSLFWCPYRVLKVYFATLCSQIVCENKFSHYSFSFLLMILTHSFIPESPDCDPSHMTFPCVSYHCPLFLPSADLGCVSFKCNCTAKLWGVNWAVVSIWRYGCLMIGDSVNPSTSPFLHFFLHSFLSSTPCFKL